MAAAKGLLGDCIGTGRDPSRDAVLIVSGDGAEVQRIALLDALPSVLKDRSAACGQTRSEPRAAEP
jgi:hypothetical protein